MTIDLDALEARADCADVTDLIAHVRKLEAVIAKLNKLKGEEEAWLQMRADRDHAEAERAQALARVKELEQERADHIAATANMRDHVQPKLDAAFVAAEKAEARVAVLREALEAWLKAYDATGPDNGPSICEHDCAEDARKALAQAERQR